MFEVLNNFSKVLNQFAPHNVLNTLVNGGARTPIYDESSFMRASGYHPELSFNEIEPGVTFSELYVPREYEAQLDSREKGHFTIYNDTGRPKRFYIEFYQDWCEVYKTNGSPQCKYGMSHPQFAPPRVVVIGPGGAEEIEFWFSTPPSPRPHPEYGDVLWMRIVIQITDEQGKRAKLTKRTKAIIPPAP